MRSYWIRVSPKSSESTLIRDTQRHTEKVATCRLRQVETGVMLPQVKEHLGTPGAGRAF